MREMGGLMLNLNVCIQGVQKTSNVEPDCLYTGVQKKLLMLNLTVYIHKVCKKLLMLNLTVYTYKVCKKLLMLNVTVYIQGCKKKLLMLNLTVYIQGCKKTFNVEPDCLFMGVQKTFNVVPDCLYIQGVQKLLMLNPTVYKYRMCKKSF